jgi:hypothetical protein
MTVANYADALAMRAQDAVDGLRGDYIGPSQIAAAIAVIRELSDEVSSLRADYDDPFEFYDDDPFDGS